MKAGGINIISTYIFWIHHEPEEGKWNWSGNHNLRRFVRICAEENVMLVLRLGPFCHGKCIKAEFLHGYMRKPGRILSIRYVPVLPDSLKIVRSFIILFLLRLTDFCGKMAVLWSACRSRTKSRSLGLSGGIEKYCCEGGI